MTYKKLQIVSFLVFLLAVLILVILIAKPFLNILAFGVIIAILFSPIYQKILRMVRSPNLAGLLTVLLILLIVLVPLSIFGQIIFNEVFGFYNQYKTGDLNSSNGALLHLSPQIQSILQTIMNQVGNAVQNFTNDAFNSVSNLLSNVVSFFVGLFLFFFTIFFSLRDGDKIKQVIMDISPIAQEQEYLLFKKVSSAVNGVVKGAFLVALIQGTMATVGFLIFGAPQPFIWGLFTVIAALVPVVGTSLSMIPAVIYLFLTGNTGAGIGLAIWAAFGVSLIDNFVGPKLIGSRTKLHPLLVFISLLGGIQFFGFVGFLLGPIIMAVFVALVDMYRIDFKAYLEQ